MAVAFTISPATTASLLTCFVSWRFFLNISKFSSEPILFEKFLKWRPNNRFFIPLCFLFKYLLSNISRYSFGLTAKVKMQGSSMCSIS